MAKVARKDNEHIDSLLRRFKRFVIREGILQEYKRHAYYEKPTTMRRRKQRQNERNWFKRQRQMEE